MDSKVLVGVGNIYACESLYIAKINPNTPAKNLSEQKYSLLGRSIRNVLKKAINSGGTTLKDFVDHQGKPGYFKQCLIIFTRTITI